MDIPRSRANVNILEVWNCIPSPGALKYFCETITKFPHSYESRQTSIDRVETRIVATNKCSEKVQGINEYFSPVDLIDIEEKKKEADMEGKIGMRYVENFG